MSVSVMIALPEKEKQDTDGGSLHNFQFQDEIISNFPNQTNFQWKCKSHFCHTMMKSDGTYEETEIHGSVKKSYRQYWWWLW